MDGYVFSFTMGDGIMVGSVLLLIVSNIFMTFAWYGHLKYLKHHALWIVILISWGTAFLEYCFQVPANRLGNEHYSLPQLKVIQEVITMIVFSVFSIYFMKVQLGRNFIYASLCLIFAVYFIFKEQPLR